MMLENLFFLKPDRLFYQNLSKFDILLLLKLRSDITCFYRKYFSDKVASMIESNTSAANKDIFFIDDKRFYSTDDKPPIYLDRVLKQLILHDFSRYSDLCQFVSGGFIDRIPNYDLCFYFKFAKKVALYKSDMHLTSYIERNEYNLTEVKYEMMVTEEQLRFIKEFITEESLKIEEINEKVEVDVYQKILRKWKKKMPSLFSSKDLSQIQWDHNIDSPDQEIYELLDKIYESRFPEDLLHLFSKKLNLSEEETFTIFIEYLRFIILKAKNPEITLYPSFLVDQLHREHFVLTKHYRDFCKNVFDTQPILYKTLPKDIPSFKEGYGNTLDLYKSTFGVNPSTYAWRDFEEELSLINQKYYNINILRLWLYIFYEKEYKTKENFKELQVKYPELADESILSIAEYKDTKIQPQRVDMNEFFRHETNRKLRKAASDNNGGSLWRKYYSQNKLFKDYLQVTENNDYQTQDSLLNLEEKGLKPEDCDRLSLFRVGGLKFLHDRMTSDPFTKTFSDTSYSRVSRIESNNSYSGDKTGKVGMNLSLDDLADDCLESIHLLKIHEKDATVSKYLKKGSLEDRVKVSDPLVPILDPILFSINNE